MNIWKLEQIFNSDYNKADKHFKALIADENDVPQQQEHCENFWLEILRATKKGLYLLLWKLLLLWRIHGFQRRAHDYCDAELFLIPL